MQITRIKSLLDHHGLEPTPARLKIMSLCLTAKHPLTVAEVAAKMGSRAHLATIYRTLEKFAAANLLTRVDFQEGKFRYEYVHDHHHHAVCEGCGKVAEVQDKRLEAVMASVKVDGGFSITRHALELFGLCRSCQLKG